MGRTRIFLCGFGFHRTTWDLEASLLVLESDLHVLENPFHVEEIDSLVPERPLNLETECSICCHLLVKSNRNQNLLNGTFNLRN